MLMDHGSRDRDKYLAIERGYHFLLVIHLQILHHAHDININRALRERERESVCTNANKMIVD